MVRGLLLTVALLIQPSPAANTDVLFVSLELDYSSRKTTLHHLEQRTRALSDIFISRSGNYELLLISSSVPYFS
jgi:hypothetical protein